MIELKHRLSLRVSSMYVLCHNISETLFQDEIVFVVELMETIFLWESHDVVDS